jgi:hypothetical protein
MSHSQNLSHSLVLAIGLLVACADDAATPTKCGADTVLIDDVCVTRIVDVVCGTGTTLDPETRFCVPDITCGSGATYDPASGECKADSVCGPNTTLNVTTGLCEPDTVCGNDTTFNAETGLCEPDVVCGAGTTLVDGDCIGDNRCGTGTVYEASTGLCSPLLVCGSGLSVHEGFCLTPAQIVADGGDAAESLPDLNDTNFLLHTPETLILEAPGQETVFTGTIGRAVDIDGNGSIDQDNDVWRFTATAGQRLRIRVLSDGMPGPSFVLTGPQSFQRSSAVTVLDEIEREVVLPYDGDYDLRVAPALHRLDGAPIGDDDYGYVGIIEALEWPAPFNDLTVPAAGTAATTASGDLLTGNRFYQLRAAAGRAAAVEITSEGVDTWPVLLAFRPDRSFIGQLSFVPAPAPAGVPCVTTYIDCDGSCTGSPTFYNMGVCTNAATPGSPDETFRHLSGHYLQQADEVILIVDWVWSNGVEQSYDLTVAGAPSQALGAIEPGIYEDSGKTTMPPRTAASYDFSVEAGVVVTTEFTAAADKTLIGPSGIMVSPAGDPYHFYAAEAGSYTWMLVNDEAVERPARVVVKTQAPLIAPTDTFDGTGVVAASYSGSRLGMNRYGVESVWILAENTVPALMRGSWSYATGILRHTNFRVGANGTLIDSRTAATDDYLFLSALRDEPDLTMFQVHNSLGGRTPDPVVYDWDLLIEALPIPTVTEIEPNDDLGMTTQTDFGALSGLPAFRAFAANENAIDEYDHFSFSISGALAANEIFRVSIENVDSSAAPRMFIYNSSRVQIYPLSGDTTPLTSDDNISWPLRPVDGPGPFFIRIEATNTSGPVRYIVELERRIESFEVEPNNTIAAPQNLGTLTLPFTIDGFCGGTSATNGDLDIFRFDVPTLGATEGLRFRIDNIADTSDLKPALYDTNGTSKIFEDDQGEHVWFFRPAASGPYYLEVKSDVTSATSRVREQYRVSIDLAPNVEVEPNNDGATASTAGSLAADSSVVIWGHNLQLASDYYRIDLTTPIALPEVVSVRWENLTQRGNTQVHVYGADGTTPIVDSEMYAHELVIAPLDGEVGPLFVQVIPDHTSANMQAYRLEVERISGLTGESEPNNDQASSQTVALGSVIRAQSMSTSSTNPADPDVYRFVLDRDLVAGEFIRVTGTVPLDLIDLIVTARDDQFVTLATVSDPDPQLEFVPTLITSGSAFYVELQSASATGKEMLVYEAVVEIVTP